MFAVKPECRSSTGRYRDGDCKARVVDAADVSPAVVRTAAMGGWVARGARRRTLSERASAASELRKRSSEQAMRSVTRLAAA